MSPLLKPGDSHHCDPPHERHGDDVTRVPPTGSTWDCPCGVVWIVSGRWPRRWTLATVRETDWHFAQVDALARVSLDNFDD